MTKTTEKFVLLIENTRKEWERGEVGERRRQKVRRRRTIIDESRA